MRLQSIRCRRDEMIIGKKIDLSIPFHSSGAATLSQYHFKDTTLLIDLRKTYSFYVMITLCQT